MFRRLEHLNLLSFYFVISRNFGRLNRLFNGVPTFGAPGGVYFLYSAKEKTEVCAAERGADPKRVRKQFSGVSSIRSICLFTFKKDIAAI